MCSLILSATPGSNNGSCTLVDLTSVGEIPIMPTLSGWLLQYPVVYLAHPDTAVMMAQLLSEAVLVLYDVQVAGLFTEVGLQTQFTGSPVSQSFTLYLNMSMPSLDRRVQKVCGCPTDTMTLHLQCGCACASAATCCNPATLIGCS